MVEKNGSESLLMPAGRECVGDTRTSEVKAGLSDFAKRRASIPVEALRPLLV